MGKGDKKTRKGKITRGSYGVSRPRKKTTAGVSSKTPKPKKVENKEEKVEKKAETVSKAKKKPAAKKPADKKPAAKKPAKKTVKKEG